MAGLARGLSAHVAPTISCALTPQPLSACKKYNVCSFKRFAGNLFLLGAAISGWTMTYLAPV